MLFLGNQNNTNNSFIARNSTTTNALPTVNNNRTNPNNSGSNNRDSGFGSINRTNHDRSSTFGQHSNITRPSNTTILQPPRPSNSISSNLPSSSGQTGFSFGNPNGDVGEIVCNCNVETKLFTVRKEGPNTGNALFSYFLFLFNLLNCLTMNLTCDIINGI